jgi:uncharacterized protein YkwD
MGQEKKHNYRQCFVHGIANTTILMLMMLMPAYGQSPTDTLYDDVAVDREYYARLIFEEINEYRELCGKNRLRWDSSIADDCKRRASKICEGDWVTAKENCAAETHQVGVVRYRTYGYNAKKTVDYWKQEYYTFRKLLLGDMNIGAVGIDEKCLNIVFRISTDTVNSRVRPPLYKEPLKETDKPKLNNFDIKLLERLVIESISRHRERNGLRPLRWDYVLAEGCRTHSEWLAKTGKFVHASDIESSGECISGFGLGRKDTAKTYREMADQITQIWINSPGHNSILLQEFSDKWGEAEFYGGIGIERKTDLKLGVPVKINENLTVTPNDNEALATFRIRTSRLGIDDSQLITIKMNKEEESALQKRLLSIKSKKLEEEKNRKTSEKIILWIKKIKLSL